MKKKYKILDLFCKAGGAGEGYHRAGFEVVGVDIFPQTNYPYTFFQSDAIEFLRTADLSGFDAIHASPPCQAHTKAQALSKGRNNGKYGEHPDFIPQTREILKKIGKPYIIENVDGAPLVNPIALYGSQFKNLYTQRKRLFESNIELRTPDTPMVQKKNADRRKRIRRGWIHRNMRERRREGDEQQTDSFILGVRTGGD